MSSEAFNKAIELVSRHPLPNDVVSQLSKLESSIDSEEKFRFACLMEGVYLMVNDESNSFPHLMA